MPAFDKSDYFQHDYLIHLIIILSKNMLYLTIFLVFLHVNIFELKLGRYSFHGFFTVTFRYNAHSVSSKQDALAGLRCMVTTVHGNCPFSNMPLLAGRFD